MTGPDPLVTRADELSSAADAWLPTSDPVARETIFALLDQVAATGVDPIAQLRDGVNRWFGARALAALPPQTTRTKVAAGAGLALEPLYTLRQPTLWPQRPKRLPDELFSSWLWRAALAANVPPRVFAKQVTGGNFDVDRDMGEAALRHLAQVTGQTAGHLAGGLLHIHPGAVADSEASLIENVMLADGRFLARRGGYDAAGRANPVLQFCPACLAADARPYFRRSWRLAHVVACQEHGCRLHDRCWQCGKPVAPLGQRTTNPVPCCPCCDAVLAAAPATPSRGLRRQAALIELLLYLATRVPAGKRFRHLDALHKRLRPVVRAPVAEREAVIAGLLPSSVSTWFGRPVDGRHDVNFQLIAEGVSPERLAAAARQDRARRKRSAKRLISDADDTRKQTSKLSDYSETARTLTWTLIEGQRERIATSAFQGAQSADQNRKHTAP